MDADRLARIETAFHEVRSARPSTPIELNALLDLHCKDADIRREVESLLAADDSGFLSANAPESLRGSAAIEGNAIGHRFGKYHVVDTLGEGGMGEVYVGERIDGAYQQRVAIKVLRGLRNEDDARRRRFERERDILARLQHPGIAYLLDGGTDEAGRPYLVMELVEGVPIDQYCREHNPPLQTRLRLLIAVCEAISHAHQHLIIHRDIKPGNVLVVPQVEGEPAVKVIDFGIALPAFLGHAATLHTSGQRVLGTLAYMSPEQCAHGSADADVRTDVYALGVLAYELLANRAAFDFTRSGWADAISAITERPTPRLSDANSRIARDLDTIVATAMAKDPSRRYRSVGELADDLGRYLDARPIRARPASVWYLSRTFARRHRVPMLAAGTTGGAVLLAVFAMIVWFAVLPRWSDAKLHEARLALLTPRTQSLIYAPIFFNYRQGTVPPQPGPGEPRRFADAIENFEGAAALAFHSPVARREAATVRAASILHPIPVDGWRAHGRPTRFAPGAWAIVTADDLDAAIAGAAPADLRDAGLLFLLTRHPGRSIRVMRRYEAVIVGDPLLEALLGEMYLAMERPDLAYPRLRAAYEEFPRSRMVAIALAEAAIGVGDLPRAEALLATVAELPDPDPYGRLSRVRAQFAAARSNVIGPDEGIRRFRAASLPYDDGHPMRRLDDAAGNPVAQYNFGQWLESRGEYEAALNTYYNAACSHWVIAGEPHRVPMVPLAAYVRCAERWFDAMAPGEAERMARGDSAGAKPSELLVHLRMYDLARAELRHRPSRIALGPADERRLAAEREGWANPTPVSNLAQALAVGNSQLWAALDADERLREDWITAAVEGDPAARAEIQDRVLAGKP